MRADDDTEKTKHHLSQKPFFPFSTENYEVITMCQTSVETLLLQQLVLPAIEEDALGLFHTHLLSVIHRTTTLIKIISIPTHLEVQDLILNKTRKISLTVF